MKKVYLKKRLVKKFAPECSFFWTIKKEGNFFHDINFQKDFGKMLTVKCILILGVLFLSEICSAQLSRQESNQAGITDESVFSNNVPEERIIQISAAEWNQVQADLAAVKLQMSEEAEKAAKKKVEDEEKKRQTPQTKIQGRIYLDAMSIDHGGAHSVEDDTFGTAARTARLGVKGTQFEMIEYELLFDFSGDKIGAKNVYAGFRNLPCGIGIRLGHFKEPWSLENLTSSRHGMMMERSLLNTTKDFCGGRNNGIMFHNWDRADRWTWAAGIFAASMAESLEPIVSDSENIAFTARTTFLPFYEKEPDGFLRLWHIGGAFSVREYDMEKASDLKTRLKVTPGNNYSECFSATFSGLDSLTAFQMETSFVYGSLSFDFEQAFFSLDDEFAGNADIQSGYAGVSWILTGESRNYDRKVGRYVALKPENPFVRTCREGIGFFSGPGAWEIAYRFSWLDANEIACFEYGEEPGKTFCHTVGLNWYLNSKCRILFNYVYADTKHSSGERGNESIFQSRFQIDF